MKELFKKLMDWDISSNILGWLHSKQSETTHTKDGQWNVFVIRLIAANDVVLYQIDKDILVSTLFKGLSNSFVSNKVSFDEINVHFHKSEYKQ